MSRAFIFVFFLAGWVMQSRTVAQTIVSQSKYLFKHFDTKDGLASEFAYSLAQDSLGFIWVQYAFGLSRYDGYRFKVYRPDRGDSANSLLNIPLGRLITDHSGNLWITVHTQEGNLKLTRYDSKRDAFITYSPEVSGGIVSKIEFEKKTSNVWLGLVEGKGLCRFNPTLSQTEYFLNKNTDSLSHAENATIYDLADRDSTLLLATAQGLWIFNKMKGTFVRPKANLNDHRVLCKLPIRDIYEDPNESWLLLDSIMIRINNDFSIKETIYLPEVFQIKTYDRDLQFNTYARDGDGNFWFASRNNGIYRLDPNDHSFINITSDAHNPQSLRTNNLNGILVDKEKNVWVATHRGISQLADQSITFHNFTFPGAVIDAGAVHKTKLQDYIVINSNKQNTDQEILITPLNPKDPTTLSFKKLTSVKGISIHAFWTGRNYFWISAYSGGIVGLPINRNTGKIERKGQVKLSHDPKNENTISSDLTGGIFEDTAENLWVGTRGGGLNKVNLKTRYGENGAVTRYSRSGRNPASLSSDIVWDVYPSSDESIFVVTERGIDRYYDGRLSSFLKDRMGHAIHQTAEGKIYVAGGTGLFEIRDADGKHVHTRIPSLSNEDFRAIQADTLGRLWLSTTEGLFCYDPVENIILKFNEENGVGHARAINVFKRSYLTSTGNIVISDPDGITLFNPHTLRVSRTKTYPLITGLTVSNKPVVVGRTKTAGGKFTLDRSIHTLDKLVLDHLNNNFSVEFSAMQMTSPKQNQYRHRLEGYDQEWIETDSRSRTASYTNLAAGTYILRIKASNHHGIWSGEERMLQVIILPPPWQTWWAYTLYALLFLLLIRFWRTYDIKRVKLKHRTEQLSELDSLKTKFFANISHEFRTPVTLILGPLQDLYKTAKDENQKHMLRLMIRNGERLLRLINQLLDLSKIEAGKMKLHIRQVDIVQFIREIMSSYEPLASEKKIKYLFYTELHELFVYMDPEKMEKVIHNLLSNSFKFTRSGGEVIVHLHRIDKYSILSVKDTGVGIPNNDLEKIFDRFYQVDSSQTRAYEGTGLGMALAKEIVELHSGKIAVESVEGKGTTFKISLYLGREHFRNDDINDSIPSRNEEPFFRRSSLINETPPSAEPAILSADQAVILIAEDNQDMRGYICRTLCESYCIQEAANGRQALDKTMELLPDLVITDVMMPEIDGYTLCKKIKSTEITSHIPVILLTAKADRDSKLTGLATGADDYLSKPFDAEELRIIVRNRIEQRKIMRSHFSREITLQPKQIQITSLDEKFLSRALGLIEEHMADENFSIEAFSLDAGYSRMQLYRKIKALTGQTPSQFVRTIRLKRAAQLLQIRSDNITQIAYSVGFGSLSYFNKCFKEQFGVTPGQFFRD